MNDRFFKQTVTLFLFRRKEQKFDRFVINNVYFRKAISTRMTDNGLVRTSAGSVTIPTAFATIDGEIAIKTYDKKTNNLLNFVLNGVLLNKTWTLNGKSYLVEGEVEDMSYKELVEKYHTFRIISVQDNRKGNLQHFKIEVEE